MTVDDLSHIIQILSNEYAQGVHDGLTAVSDILEDVEDMTRARQLIKALIISDNRGVQQ